MERQKQSEGIFTDGKTFCLVEETLQWAYLTLLSFLQPFPLPDAEL